MCITCHKCGYDSGDRDDANELARKVISDGGKMELVEPISTVPRNPQHPDAKVVRCWDIECPNGHSGDVIRLD
jgi:hypothetical protein